MTLAEKQRVLTEELGSIRNTQERLAHLLARSRKHPPLDAQFKTDAFRVEGCMARLWLASEWDGCRCVFHADSDSAIVRAIALLLCDFYSGHSPAEILQHEPAFLSEVGITQHLTPNRRNSLSRIWEKIQSFARDCAENISAQKIK